MERFDAVSKIRETGSQRGVGTGFRDLDKLWTMKRGFPLFVAGAPHHGKSIFVKQLVVNAADNHGWRSLLFMAEEGGADDLIVDLVEMKMQMDARKLTPGGLPNERCMSDQTFVDALSWVNRHFAIIDPDDVANTNIPFTLDLFFEIARRESFDMTVLDPWNDVDRDLEKHGGREDLQLTDALRDIRRESAQQNRIDIVVTHIAKVAADKKADCGTRYQGHALPTEWAGGQTWFRRAFTMLLVYRPPEGLVIDESGQPIEPGECWVYCQKTKPKGVGRLGMVKLWWQRDKHRFVERDESQNEFGPNQR
jgi:hypothetical protein